MFLGISIAEELAEDSRSGTGGADWVKEKIETRSVGEECSRDETRSEGKEEGEQVDCWLIAKWYMDGSTSSPRITGREYKGAG